MRQPGRHTQPQRTVAFAIIASLLLATTPTAATTASSDTLAVGSQHTTNADFSGAQTLSNLTVVDGAVTLEGGGVNYGFEDEPADSGVPENWETVSAPESQSVQNSTVYEGAQAWKIVDTSDAAGARPASQPYASKRTGTISFAVHTDNEGQVRVREDGTTLFMVGIRSGDLQVYNGSAWQTVASAPDANEWVAVNITSIDVTADEITVEWSEAGGTTGQSTVSLASDITDGYDETVFRIYQSTTYFDSIRIESQPVAAKYVSPVHNVSRAEAAAINVTAASNVSINATVRTDGGTVLNQSTLTSPGNHTLALADTSSDKLEVVLDVSVTGAAPAFRVADESILFDNHAPTVNDLQPSDGAKLTSTGVTLSANVSDPEFGTAQGETLTVEFQTQAPGDSTWTTQATKTVNSNGSTSTTVSGLEGGTWDWRVVVSDSYGASTTSQTYSFKVPDTLYIRNESAPSELVTSEGNVTLRFFTEDGDIYTRKTSDGTVNLTDLPVSEPMLVSAEVQNYSDRTIYIESIYQQQTVYLLPTSASSVEVRFTLLDRTGKYGSDSVLFIEKPITRNGTTIYQTVVANEFGVAGLTTTLETGSRYRLRVKNDEGDTRVSGSYTAEVSETVQLEIGEVQVNAENATKAWTYNASYINDSTGSYVQFAYEDAANATSTIWVKIHEYGNESNVLLANQSFDGPFGTFQLTKQVPTSEVNTTWAIDVTLERNGETIQFTAVAGPTRTILQSFPGWLMALISVGSLWVVGGLFSQLNGDIGGLIVSGLGATYWYLGFMPQEVGQGVVALALIMAGVLFINERRGEAGL